MASQGPTSSPSAARHALPPRPPPADQVLGKRPPSPTITDIAVQRPRTETAAEQSEAASSGSVLSRLPHPLAATAQSPFTSFPAFQKPQRLASFSFDAHRTLHHDDRCRRLFRPPFPGADLNYGFERFTQRDESVNEHLDALLDSLRHRSLSVRGDGERIEADAQRYRADVVTWRGIGTKICTAWDQLHPPSGGRTEGFELNAMLVENTLYLEEHVGGDKKAEKARREGDERMRRFGYYGYSFESWCTDPGPDAPTSANGNSNGNSTTIDRQHPPGWGGDVNTNEQWCLVIKTRLGNNRLILGGEVDCAMPSRPSAGDGGEDKLVELKTSVSIRPHNRRDVDVFEAKLLKFYIQSFLLGVQTLVVGFRDQQGRLVTTQHFDTLGVPKLVRADGGSEAGVRGREKSVWDPTNSIGFGNDLLEWLKREVGRHSASSASDGLKPVEEAVRSYPVFRVSFQPPFREVTLRRLEDDEVRQDIKGAEEGERVGFLPRRHYEFVADMARLRAEISGEREA